MTKKKKPMHGTAKARGCAHAQLGKFCKMFPKIPESQAKACNFDDDPCRADDMASALGRPGGPMHDTRDRTPDSEIPAAYTFFAQFVDHDITLDTQTQLRDTELSDSAINKLGNLRTPTLDLDCVYGFGPEASPHLYDSSQEGRLLVGSDVEGRRNSHDVPRNAQGRALIGDPRNDENIFVSQLQMVFLRFHNRLLVRYPFEEAQRVARYHYQYVVWKDFLRRVCDPGVFEFADDRLFGSHKTFPLNKTAICIHDPATGHHRVCMPVEFSVAAYRFGHTTVRSEYAVNGDFPSIELFDERFQSEGFGQVPPELVVDWRFLLDIEPGFTYQRTKAFDSLLTDELIRMPDPVVGARATTEERSLAFRNLRRGVVLGLPSGQSVAAQLRDLGYPGIDPSFDLQFDNDDVFARAWQCIDNSLRSCLEQHTPLFLYLMREAALAGEGLHLGPVGSALLLEVFGAMLTCCQDSFLSQEGWAPDEDIAGCRRRRWRNPKDPAHDGDLTLADIVQYALESRSA